MRRYAETFFQRPLLYLVPFLAIIVAASLIAARAVNTAPAYTATATVAVNLDPAKIRPLGERPASEHNAELLGELLRTDAFLEGALSRTSLAAELATSDQAETLVRRVRANWRQSISGLNTIQVAYRCDIAEQCTEVVAAVLAAFRDEVVRAALVSVSANVAFYETQLKAAEQSLRSIPPSDPAWNGARVNYEAMLPELTRAKRDEALEGQKRREEFRVIAAPRSQSAPTARLMAGMLPLVAGGIAALVATAGLVVLGTWLDRTIRSPQDALERLNVRTIASIPRLKRQRHGVT